MDNRTINQIRNNETKLINEIKVLEQQCKKQKEIIDEARECIKNNYHLNWYVESNYKDELLQILDKGESNETLEI